MVLRRQPSEKEIIEYNLNFFRLYYGLSLEELNSFREKYDDRLLSVLGSNEVISRAHGQVPLRRLKLGIERLKERHEKIENPPYFNIVMARHFGYALRNFDSLVQVISEGKRAYTYKLLQK
ncbi:hypothetical protein HUU53_03975 [Candidatus Micrarchaeota archaeon]|nr:hypothetical protein [Candidatus Micrarchaeota archaeon]